MRTRGKEKEIERERRTCRNTNMQIWRAAAVLIAAANALGEFAIPVPDPSHDASTEAAWVDPATEATSPPTTSTTATTTDTKADEKEMREEKQICQYACQYSCPNFKEDLKKQRRIMKVRLVKFFLL